MRVVIVGGAGFLGCAIGTRLAAAGHAVRVLDTAGRLAAQSGRLGGFECAPFDFSSGKDSSDLLAGAGALVHLGCTTNPAQSMLDMAHDAESNIGPSLRLFDSAARAGVRRVVFSSSGGTVYGAPRQLPVREDHAPAPLSAYGVSKWAIEGYLAIDPRLEGVSLRIANPYGPQQLEGAAVGVIARYVAQLARGERLQVWGDGSVVRDYIAVEDVADAFLAAVESPAMPERVYNIGSGTGLSLREVIDAVFAACGREVPVDYLPRRDYDVPAIVLDSSAFTRWTGWTPRIPLAEGLSRLWDHAKADPPA